MAALQGRWVGREVTFLPCFPVTKCSYVPDPRSDPGRLRATPSCSKGMKVTPRRALAASQVLFAYAVQGGHGRQLCDGLTCF